MMRAKPLGLDAQPLPPAAQVAFARLFGPVQVHVMSMDPADGHPALYRLSHLGADGKPSAKQSDLAHGHPGQVNELIVWDKRRLLHRATACDPATQSRMVRAAPCRARCRRGDTGTALA